MLAVVGEGTLCLVHLCPCTLGRAVHREEDIRRLVAVQASGWPKGQNPFKQNSAILPTSNMPHPTRQSSSFANCSLCACGTPLASSGPALSRAPNVRVTIVVDCPQTPLQSADVQGFQAQKSLSPLCAGNPKTSPVGPRSLGSMLGDSVLIWHNRWGKMG